MVLMSSCTSAELLDPSLAPESVLFRLFHEDGVRVFAPDLSRVIGDDARADVEARRSRMIGEA